MSEDDDLCDICGEVLDAGLCHFLAWICPAKDDEETEDEPNGPE